MVSGCVLLNDLFNQVISKCPISDDAMNDAVARGQTAKVILEMLIGSLRNGSGSPNLALFALGFDVRSPENTQLENPGLGFELLNMFSLLFFLNFVLANLKKANFQCLTNFIEILGVNNFVQTCLHSVVNILLSVLAVEDALVLPHCGLVDPALRLLITLASFRDTMEPTLRHAY